MATGFARGWRLKWLSAISLLGGGVAAGFFLVLRHAPPPPCLILHQPASGPLPFRDRLIQAIPGHPAWAWLYHLEDTVFGRRKSLLLDAELIATPNASRTGLAACLPRTNPQWADPTGLRIWLLENHELKMLQQNLLAVPGARLLSHPRISTGDGIGASLFTGEPIVLDGHTNDIGLRFDCFPRVRSRSTDLSATIRFTEVLTNQLFRANSKQLETVLSIRTNLDTGARLQIPHGSGVVFLQQSTPGSNAPNFCFIINAR
ncbi:MAG TPA: hypothetical protein VG167_06795 [Verrucomicrobiae bacterium]|nr:hypothetical protein [Verrucomicrobiae bacterium]